MGRDDAKAVPGLQGGTAPARAFAQFMKAAVAKRPIEPFETELTLPDWQLEPDDMANLSAGRTPMSPPMTVRRRTTTPPTTSPVRRPIPIFWIVQQGGRG
jgi:membrane peptidoglycan carboxypeptidase